MIKKFILTLILLITTNVGCDKSTDSFSLTSNEIIYQPTEIYVPRKIDILWVIDNSGSMSTSQTNLGNNFRSFINKFIDRDLDYRIAVTTTDAYWGKYTGSTSNSRIKDGTSKLKSGYFVIDKNTINIDDVFLTNIMQGTNGNGDERAFSSFEETLNNNLNADFRRPDAFLAIIIVSDEDDFSHDDFYNGSKSYYFTENYNDSKMYTTDYYVEFLKQITQSSADKYNFSVNSISIIDSQCLTKLANGSRKIGHRYIDLVDKTKGVKSSLCSEFGPNLELISDSIIQLSSIIQLNRKPIVETIKVYVGDQFIQKDSINGWSYDPLSNSITLNGNSSPKNGEKVYITYDPIEVKI